MKKWVVRGALTLTGILVLVVGGIALTSCAAMGSAADGQRLARMHASPQWHTEEDAFGNRLPRVDGSVWDMLDEFLGSEEKKRPEQTPSIQRRTGADYATPPASGLRVTWLGHSTLLVEIDGQRVLLDPVWGEYASPFSWTGPQRWYEPPLPLDELPELDAVIISHDHYDHLDYPTVEGMLARDVTWVVPLGIGAHLEGWGVPAERVVELDWWEDTRAGGLTITCTPARHFSGRGLSDQNGTLWAGWAVKGAEHNVFYSGDTALHPAFKTIGDKLGPFDLTMMESGAYDPLWADVHLGPEQAVIAHQLVGGNVMLPVHWGLFDLANHGWVEPIERVLAAAEKVGVTVVAPRPGGWAEPADGAFVDRWWASDVPWKTVRERPAWSSSVAELQRGSPLYVGPEEETRPAQ